jgi:hypothetical protein
MKKDNKELGIFMLRIFELLKTILASRAGNSRLNRSGI